MDTILPYLPLPPSPSPFKEYAATDVPPPLYEIRFVDQENQGSTARAEFDDEADALESGWEWATLKRNTRATASDWFQDVREIDMKLESRTE